MVALKTYIFYMQPTAGFRPEFRSDTLWGLICWGLRHLYGEVELLRFLATYTGEDAPELVLSSAFPYKMDSADKLLFFPMPLVPSHLPDDDERYLELYRLRKEVKKIRWINQDDFNKLLSGRFSEKDLWERAAKTRKMNDPDTAPGSFGAERQALVQQRAPRMESKSFTHNTIDRINLSTLKQGNRAGQLFHIEERFLVDDFNESKDARNTGLFFLARCSEDTCAKLAAVLRYYRFNGLGGDRSTGKGTFNCSHESFELLQEPADANAQTNLSLYLPKADELGAFAGSPENDLYSYLLERRQGRVGFWNTNARKENLLYFREGSVFPLMTGKTHFGSTTNRATTNQTFNYYAYGHAFMVKMKI